MLNSPTSRIAGRIFHLNVFAYNVIFCPLFTTDIPELVFLDPDSVIPGALVPVLLEKDQGSGTLYNAQDFAV